MELFIKEKILLKMDEELAVIAKGDYDLCSGENYMTAESIHYAIRNWFTTEQVPDHIVNVMIHQDTPLERMYDFYVDSGFLRKDVEGNSFIKAYITNLYHDYLRSIVHEKVQGEYQQFILDFKQRPPYDMPKMITEMTVKMQIYSLFRYDDSFEFSDRKLEQFIAVENILEKVYKDSNLKNIATEELANVEQIVISSLLKLANESENLCQIEDEDYEMG